MGSRQYGESIDIWSCGCIFAEMSSGRPLFPGGSTQDQLIRIFKILGTPSEASWPGLSKLPEYRAEFPVYSPVVLGKLVPKLDVNGIDLLKLLLEYDPSKRISAEEALTHPFFAELSSH